MIRTYFLLCCIIFVSETLSAQSVTEALAQLDKTSTIINQHSLPSPYNKLLTQPLMTKAIESHYKRTAIIQPIFAQHNVHNNTYVRTIIMLIDPDKHRNQAKFAQKYKKAIVVELAFIKINFAELPPRLISDILNTNSPFGTLLVRYNIAISTKNRRYFAIKCDPNLVKIFHCNLNEPLYGRMNTIINAENKKWLAQVVEVLPNSTRHIRG